MVKLLSSNFNPVLLVLTPVFVLTLTFVLCTPVSAQFDTGMPISWIDTDQDGLSDTDELNVYHSDPKKADTDGDTFIDGQEVKMKYSPLVAIKKMHEVDTDKDGLNDWLEIAFSTDLTRVDTDKDGLNDYEEVMHAKNPVNANSSATTTRRIEVDLSSQKLRYVVDGKLVLTMPVSTGMPITPTPVGDFKILYKVPMINYRGVDFYLPGVKWNLAFKSGGYYLHTAYWHNNFGKKTNSHGCINMREKDVALLYKYIDVGTVVKVIGNTPPRGVVVVAK